MKKQLLLGLLAVGLSVNARAADFSAEQKQQIQTIVHDYLVKNPEVLVEASQALQHKQQGKMEKMQKQAVETIRKQADAVFFNKQDPVLGNPEGDVTLVEFFDYQCEHCRDLAPTISEVIKKHPNVRVVFKEFPIFGDSSQLASKAALAAAKQDKFGPMHEALMKATDYSRESLVKMAKDLGLNVEQFQADMDSKTVQQELDANSALAKQLKIYFTPVLVIANTQAKTEDMKVVFVPGIVPAKMLDTLLDEVKQGK